MAERDTVYATVKCRFEPHFEKESVVEFIESIYELAETCQFGPLKEELIRDCIVVGIRNATKSLCMQDEKLTLEKAVKEAKSSELVKHHKMPTTDGDFLSQKKEKTTEKQK